MQVFVLLNVKTSLYDVVTPSSYLIMLDYQQYLLISVNI